MSWIAVVFPDIASFIFRIDDSSLDGETMVPRLMDPNPIPSRDDRLATLGGDGDEIVLFNFTTVYIL